MQGVAALLCAGAGDVTFEAVSEASGVPQRTLYRRYANKDALFDVFWSWLNTAIAAPEPPRDAEELVAYVPKLFAAFERDEPLVRAMLHTPHGRATRLAQKQARRAKFETSLAAATASLEADAAQRQLAAVAALCSATTWETLKDEWGMTGAEAARTVQAAVTALVGSATTAPVSLNG
jgi:AcrR family transcriptional regulator